jgi:hypothetical protein
MALTSMTLFGLPVTNVHVFMMLFVRFERINPSVRLRSINATALYLIWNSILSLYIL